MDDTAVARAIHVLAVVLWIGGVGFVTTVVLPVIGRSRPPEERLAVFHRFEQAFAWQAGIGVALAGLSGFYMVYRFDLWDRFGSGRYWWMDAMLGLWLIFATMLFVIEPLALNRRWSAAARDDPKGHAFARIRRLHEILFVLSLIVVFAAVGGAHGLF